MHQSETDILKKDLFEMIKEEARFAPGNVMEGMVSFRAVIEAMKTKPNTYKRKITKVYFDQAKLKNISGHLSYIKAMSYEFGFEIVSSTAKEIDDMCIGSSHGGIAFECTERSFLDVTEIDLKKDGFAVILDGIEDPYNFGFSVRALYAAGVDLLVVPKRNWLSAAGVVCRSSAGASELLDIATFEGDLFADHFHKNGYKIVCAELENSVSCYDADLKLPLCLVIGGEKRGISAAIKKHCDQFVRIDYGRDFPAALSASGAATVLAFEILRQNHKSNT